MGRVEFPLVNVENQDIYDICLEIPDEHDENNLTSRINAKITFIWSYLQFHQDLLNKSEKYLKNYENVIKKCQTLIANLNGKYLIYLKLTLNRTL